MRACSAAWLAQSHSGAREIAGAALYGLYEVVRGAGGENVQAALANTADIVAFEQAVGIYVERGLGDLRGDPVRADLLGLAYVLLHFVGTAVALVGAPQSPRSVPDRAHDVRRRNGARTRRLRLLSAAPPRLSELGFSDTVTSSTGLDLSSDLLGALYNPFAAVPSLHFGYALIVGVVLAVVAQGRVWRIAGALYPAAMLLIIVATGNHFFVDAALGGSWSSSAGSRPLGRRVARPAAAHLAPRRRAAARRPTATRACAATPSVARAARRHTSPPHRHGSRPVRAWRAALTG